MFQYNVTVQYQQKGMMPNQNCYTVVAENPKEAMNIAMTMSQCNWPQADVHSINNIQKNCEVGI